MEPHFFNVTHHFLFDSLQVVRLSDESAIGLQILYDAHAASKATVCAPAVSTW